MRHWKYLKYVLRHKWFVFVECLKLGVPIWFAIFHDWSKFLPSEWRAYADYFYGEKVQAPRNAMITNSEGKLVPHMVASDEVKADFNRAWNAHQKRNKHHWQYWLLRMDKPEPQFWRQSHDGGMSHVTLADGNGKTAALIYDADLSWLKVERETELALVRDLNSVPIPLPMPDVYRREMLADWRGAGRAINGNDNTLEWYRQNRDNIQLHPETRGWIEYQLNGIGSI